MDIEFHDIRFVAGSDYFPWKRGPHRDILQGVSGCFRSGELSAILGPSGAGKSTLLNAISGYKTVGVLGRLTVDGQKRDEQKFRKMSCYIMQEDILMSSLTLDELMVFASLLKLPSDFRMKQRRTRVEEIQNTLGLSEVTNTFTECLSGGQRKRLSIALELINNPPVIFLDEPTSGLDYVTSHHLVKLLKSLAKEGRTIVCTIHQPSASLFAEFDLAYFISKGKCVYNGGTGPHMLSFLTELKLVCPESYNPADYIIELLEDDTNIALLSKGIQNGKIIWYSKEIQREERPKAIIKDVSFMEYGKTTKEKGIASSCISDKITFWMQFSTLLSRMMLQQKRSKIGIKLQLFYYIGCSFLISSMYYNKSSDADEFFNQIKFSMGVIVFHTYTHCMSPILTYPFEVKQLKKEHFNQWYGLLPYYTANTVSRLPIVIFMNQLYLTIVYALSGLPWELGRFIMFSSIGLLVSFISEALGLTIGALFSITNGSIIGPMAVAPFLGLAAYGIDFARSIPPLLVPLLRSSFMRSALFALILTAFGMDRGFLHCKNGTYCHFTDPKVGLHYMGLDNSSVWEYVLDLIIVLSLLRVTFYFSLKWRLRR